MKRTVSDVRKMILPNIGSALRERKGKIIKG
jgi:hypothetical protein